MRDKRRLHPAPAEARTRAFYAAAALLLAASPAVADPAAPPAATAPMPAGPTLNQMLDSFHPTAKQTIALRDFLGARSDKLVPLGAQPNGLSYFDLRDAKNQRTGQLAVGSDPNDGSIFLARVNGPAVFDLARRGVLPRVQNTKMRGAISALLAGTQAGPAYEAITAKQRDLFLRDRTMLALALQPITFPDRVIASEATFFADGSGYFRTIRAPVQPPAAPMLNTTTVKPPQPPIHIAAKFYPAVEGDGQKAFRSAVLGVDADITATLADLGNKVPCPPTGCAPAAPVMVKGDIHLTRWPHAIVPSAPASLIVQISPPPLLPDILQDPSTNPAPPTGTTLAPPAIIDASPPHPTN